MRLYRCIAEVYLVQYIPSVLDASRILLKLKICDLGVEFHKEPFQVRSCKNNPSNIYLNSLLYHSTLGWADIRNQDEGSSFCLLFC